jgi:hypothetical protein
VATSYWQAQAALGTATMQSLTHKGWSCFHYRAHIEITVRVSSRKRGSWECELWWVLWVLDQKPDSFCICVCLSQWKKTML